MTQKYHGTYSVALKLADRSKNVITNEEHLLSFILAHLYLTSLMQKKKLVTNEDHRGPVAQEDDK